MPLQVCAPKVSGHINGGTRVFARTIIGVCGNDIKGVCMNADRVPTQMNLLSGVGFKKI